MPADVFIDTNVFVYHLDATDRRKHALADRLIREDLQHGQRIGNLVIYWRRCTRWNMAATTW